MNPQGSQANYELYHHTVSLQMAKAYFCGLDTRPKLFFTTLDPEGLRNFLLMMLVLPLQEQSFMPSSQ